MTNKVIPLCIGKPDDGSRISKDDQTATFSRFVLPFAYKIELNGPAKSESDLFYKLNSQKNLTFTKRRKYFTRETALTLYDRAIWLDMSENWKETLWGKADTPVTLRGREFKLGMLPPRVILFEAGTNSDDNRIAELSRQGASQESLNPLRTGFLIVDIYFPEQNVNKPVLDDLLMLNEYFRYFGMPYDDHAKWFRKVFGEIPANYSFENENEKIKDQKKLQSYFERWANLLEVPIKEDNKYYHLFPKIWADNARELAYNKGNSDQNWQIYADNRTYVWTAAFLEQGGQTLQEVFNPGQEDLPLKARNYGHWVRLLNVDNPDHTSVENTHGKVTEFDRKWAETRTYKRWEHSGSWYGYCYHCGAVLAPSEYAFAPFSTYYFDTSLLLFYTKLSLFQFSKQLTDAFNDSKAKQRRSSLQRIRQQFSEFTIFYRFPLLSNQQQNIEMFELNYKYFAIEAFFNEIQHEIDNTHEFVEVIEANKLANAANKLATWGIPIAAGGLIAAIFGMNDFHVVQCLSESCSPWWDIAVEVAVVLVAVAAISLFLGRRD